MSLMINLSLLGSLTYLTDFYWLWFWVLITSSDLRGELLCHLTVTFIMLWIVMISNEGCHDNDEGFFSRNYFSKMVQPLADLHRPTLKHTHTHTNTKHKQAQREYKGHTLEQKLKIIFQKLTKYHQHKLHYNLRFFFWIKLKRTTPCKHNTLSLRVHFTAADNDVCVWGQTVIHRLICTVSPPWSLTGVHQTTDILVLPVQRKLNLVQSQPENTYTLYLRSLTGNLYYVMPYKPPYL